MKIDFQKVVREALERGPTLASWMLPGGRLVGQEYQALNPLRLDRNLGSFSVNLQTGRWADFAMTGVAGRDFVSLGAYLWGCGQFEAARRIAEYLQISLH